MDKFNNNIINGKRIYYAEDVEIKQNNS